MIRVSITLSNGRGGIYFVEDENSTETDHQIDRVPPAVKSVDGTPIVGLAPGDTVWTDTLGILVKHEITEIEVLPGGSDSQ